MDDFGRFFELLAVAVASGATVKSAAESAGCSETSGYRISRSVAFRQRVSELRTAVVDQAVGELSDSAVEVVSVLRSLMRDPAVKTSDRIAASKALLASLQGLSELGELRQRLDRLEAMLNETDESNCSAA